MKLACFTLFLLSSSVSGFAPHRPLKHTSKLIQYNEIDNVCETLTDTADDALEQADKYVLNRAKRVLDHAPMLWTLQQLYKKAGMVVNSKTINANPSVFSNLPTALSVPTWCFGVWAVIMVSQVVSVVSSSLKSDNNDLSQADITATSMANFMAMQAIGSANPLRATALTALVSGYGVRIRNEQTTIHSLGLQLMSSFTAVLTVLGVASRVATLPFMASWWPAEATGLLGVLGYYVLATRGKNRTLKDGIHLGTLAGIVVNRLRDGVSLSLNLSSVLAGATTLGAAYVTYLAADRVREAVLED